MSNKVEIGFVIKPHGLKGHVLVRFESTVMPAVKSFKSVFVLDKGTLVPFLIDDLAPMNHENVKLKLRGVDSIGAAEEIRGCALFLDSDKLPRITVTDFTGYEIYDQHGSRIGAVEEVIENPGQTLLSVGTSSGVVLIPLAEDWLHKVDEAMGTLVMNLPEGLLDL